MTDTNQSHLHNTTSPATLSLHSASHIPITYFGISAKRLVCFFILTLGLYRYYWSYKNWKIIKKTEQSDISPFWRSIFGIFFCYDLFEYVGESVKRYSSKRPFSPTRLAVWYIILHITGLGFLKIFLLCRVQRAILFNNAQIIPNYKPLKQFTRADVIWIIIGILFWGIVVGRAVMNTN